MKPLFLFFLSAIYALISLDATEPGVKESIAVCIKSIPSKERELLSRFFKRLFYHGDFSYTLLGLKPMGSIDYNLNLLAFPQFYKEPEKHLFLMALDKKGWEIWEQYKDLFIMKKYSFIKVEHDSFFGFLLINKEKTYAIIEENLPTFQELIGDGVCATDILKLLCEGKFGYYHSNVPCLIAYYKALGLLYGYGEENVKFFAKREKLLQTLKSLPIEIKTLPSEVVNYLEMEETPKICAKCQVKDDFMISSLTFELKNLLDTTRLIKGTKKNNPFLPIKKSFFLGDEKLPQTQTIIDNYDKLNDTILKIYPHWR